MSCHILERKYFPSFLFLKNTLSILHKLTESRKFQIRFINDDIFFVQICVPLIVPDRNLKLFFPGKVLIVEKLKIFSLSRKRFLGYWNKIEVCCTV